MRITRANGTKVLFVVVHDPQKRMYLLDIPIGERGSIEVFENHAQLYQLIPVTSYQHIKHFNHLDVNRKPEGR